MWKLIYAFIISIPNIMLYIYRFWRSRREMYKGNRRTWHLRFITSALNVGLGNTRDMYQPDIGVICRDINWRKLLLGHIFLFSLRSISHIYLLRLAAYYDQAEIWFYWIPFTHWRSTNNDIHILLNASNRYEAIFQYHKRTKHKNIILMQKS